MNRNHGQEGSKDLTSKQAKKQQAHTRKVQRAKEILYAFHNPRRDSLVALLHKTRDGAMETEWVRVRDLGQEIKKCVGYGWEYYVSEAEFEPIGPRTRRAENVRLINSVFLDLDYRNIPELKDRKPKDVADMFLYYACWDDDIDAPGLPLPTQIISTGNGLLVRWVLNSPVKKPGLPRSRWNLVEDALAERFKFLGADQAATDSSRIFRVPYTKNAKAMKNGRRNYEVRIIYSKPDSRPSFEEFCDKLLPYSREEALAWKREAQKRHEERARRAAERRKNGYKPSSTQNLGTLFNGITNDLFRLADLRRDSTGEVIEGWRELLTFWILNFKCRAGQVTPENFESVANAIAQQVAPLWAVSADFSTRQFGTLRRKLEAAFATLEQEAKEVRKGYAPRVATLINNLRITSEEQRHMKVLVLRTPEEKRERDRLGAEQRRRATGAVPREEYLAAHSTSREKPWEAEGISRRTWFNRRRVNKATQESNVINITQEVSVNSMNSVNSCVNLSDSVLHKSVALYYGIFPVVERGVSAPLNSPRPAFASFEGILTWPAFSVPNAAAAAPFLRTAAPELLSSRNPHHLLSLVSKEWNKVMVSLGFKEIHVGANTFMNFCRRILEDKDERYTIDWWLEYFMRISRSRFLRTHSREIYFDWMLNQRNMRDILAGKFDGDNVPKRYKGATRL